MPAFVVISALSLPTVTFRMVTGAMTAAIVTARAARWAALLLEQVCSFLCLIELIMCLTIKNPRIRVVLKSMFGRARHDRPKRIPATI